ncbi:proactivator polypeptide-like 1 isoform X1 [Brachypodium distachyon]|uniref:Saposin B-type domain-containing protein n=1 Tax=Brachypodium distachyon TaxID=15368 RepID=I1HCB9_BRADI|nr:proactivator polypeptide-like 1 isoform X1 [Brachypodium distachyon]KQK02852.1 hypothetical protein BRADI_2g04110v3 [Brachypodium distachyon]PNT69989.1 hypothetical protein BRADI_2g04110v3 [Brachypodium distachyon]|eukprot:XP_003569147.1 proactivator polypeptide-like 1 isoform X1 [Brachypodium distachyon]
MACLTRRLTFLVVLAFSAVAAESRDPYRESTDQYICMLARESLPLVSKGAGLTAANGKLCVLCEQYSTEALFYLQQNETQTEILSVLHHGCANLGPLRQQCITLVDYYIPLFFMEVSAVNPEVFCESVHLCPKGTRSRLPTRRDTCGLCHHVLVEVLTMLKDPNMKLEIVGFLLKQCSKAENYAPQCKRLVLEYIPLILVKTQKLLETTDVCSDIHACKAVIQATTETVSLSAAL